ncbi:MAG: chemotaxis protein CheW [Planctomycetota bacterium]|jgi:purine-binding chemotaxis protein CheW|nr:chemotaxis protein CheW [Planctomycetota bacterium]
MTTDVKGRGGKYLTFVLNEEQYGIEILKVREILGVLPITPMPQAPHFVKGVINLRGKVIPVIDSRLKFGMMEKEVTPETCIIVVDVNGAWMGMIVDTVKEVMDIRDEQIEDAPRMGGGGDSGIRGLGKVGNQVKILLDIDKVMSDMVVTEMPSFEL